MLREAIKPRTWSSLVNALMVSIAAVACQNKVSARAVIDSEPSATSAVRWCLPSDDAVATRLVWYLQGLADRGDSSSVEFRQALENFPLLPDSAISMVSDENLCRRASVALDSSFFEPARQSPLYLARAGPRYVAHPPNIAMGEFGYLVHLDSTFRMLVINLW